MRISEPSPQPAPRGFALFALGFRPFYLLAALFSAAGVLAWVGMLEGRLAWPRSLTGPLWHAHEMVFGFALAVISGFLLTAGRVWTGLATPTGGALAALAALWLAARVLLVTGPYPLAAALDAIYPFVLAAVMGRVIVASRSKRNYFVVALLCALGAVNGAFHLGAAGLLAWAPQEAIKAALYLVLTLVVVIGGRVVPSFTANALPRAGVVMRPRVDGWTIGMTLAAFVCDLAGVPGGVTAAAALVAAALHVARQAGWAPYATRGVPLLWIMHASYSWFPVGFVLLGLAALGLVAPAAALHAFGLGAMGGMIIAMITRTALGHTARPLQARTAEVACYLLVHAAAIVRVAAAFGPDAGYAGLISTAGVLWSTAFLAYFIVYLPRLVAPRLDGKPG